MVSTRPIRVLVADDDLLTCQLLRLRLEDAGFQVAATAGDGKQAVDLALKLRPEVIVLDISMPDMDGLEALSEIKRSRPQTSIIILTAHENPHYLARAIACGAAAYLTKRDVDLRNLPRVVRAVMEGEMSVVGKDLLQAALGEVGLEEPAPELEESPPISDLTDQERRVLKLIAKGLSNDEIADTLVVSYNTVKTHTRNIFSKLEVSDRTQAALVAIRSGLSD